MLILAAFTSLVAVATAVQNPHGRAASFRKPANGLRKRELPAALTEHQYLNNKTESKCKYVLVGSETVTYNHFF